MAELAFRIDVTDPARRELEVTLEVPAGVVPAGPDRQLFLPTWTPGSYLIREYARQLGPVELVRDEPQPLIRCEKVGKNRFRLPESAGEAFRVRYRVYAHELSVRTADVGDTHAYWNHACVLLWPVAADQHGARIEVEMPGHWTHACSLPSVVPTAPPVDHRDTRTICLVARDIDHAIDSPFLAGQLLRMDWDILGVPHTVVCSGLAGVAPPISLQQDITAIVQSAAAVFGGTLPYERYLFTCLFTDSGHGGLEHAESTTLLMSRTALHDRKGYLEFLSLAAHELFHAWNVKRMRPVEFWRYDYENENYTRLLWLIEGWTAYFDDLLTLRAGLSRRDEYLGTLAENLDRMRSSPGRFVLSLEESSHDAWIRLYRPDENTRNSSQNYYGNGAVAAACLDLRIRQLTRGQSSLETVIRRLFEQTLGAGRGYSRSDVEAVLADVAGRPAVQALASLVDGPLDPDLPGMFHSVGIQVVEEGAGSPFLGITFEGGGTSIASVQRGSAAHDSGLAPGDEILALQGLRVRAGNWKAVLSAVARVGQSLEVLYVRRGVIGTCRAVPSASQGTIRLSPSPDATAEQVALRETWLMTTAQPRAFAASPGGDAPPLDTPAST